MNDIIDRAFDDVLDAFQGVYEKGGWQEASLFLSNKFSELDPERINFVLDKLIERAELREMYEVCQMITELKV